jgi:hypothetical protein
MPDNGRVRRPNPLLFEKSRLALGIAIFLYILIEPSNSALFVLHQLFVEGR